jgi:hypothetical protein
LQTSFFFSPEGRIYDAKKLYGANPACKPCGAERSSMTTTSRIVVTANGITTVKHGSSKRKYFGVLGDDGLASLFPGQ